MAMSRSHHRTTILADDSVVVFDEITQRMISLNRTAGYLWFRYHQMVGAAELARELAERCGMPSADAERTVDECIEHWRNAGFLETQGTIKQHDAAALNHRGTTLYARNEVAEALACFRGSIALWPEHARAHVNLGMALLRDGQFAAGIVEFEWRWRGYKDWRLPDISAPFWDGRPLGEGTLLLWAEQGLGDVIQFARYAPLLRELAGRTVLTCPPALIRVMAGAKGIDQVVPFGEPLPPCDAYVPLLTVMQRLGTTLDTIPAEVPYVTVDPQRAAALAPLLSVGGLKVGLVWDGNPRQSAARNRSVPLAALRPLLAVAGAKFFSLQVGPRAKDIAEAGLADQIIDLSHYFDFADSAAALSRLDLLITVDTSIAHLAGALARPTWLLLPFSPDWRWLLKRTGSPWYPTMRLFRQGQLGEWTLVIQEVATALADLIARSPRKPARLSQSIRRDETALRAASWTGEGSLDGRLPGLGFRIRYEPCRLGELLQPPLEQMIRESAGQVDLTIDLRSDEEGWMVLGDELVFGHCARASELVPMVKSRLMHRLLDGARHAIAFHAGAVSRKGRCLLLPGLAGSGKTTLCAALVQSGFEFISDDLVLLEQGSRALFGAPFPFALKEGSWLVLRRMFPEIDVLPVHLRADRKEVKCLVAPIIAPVGDAYPAGWIVFPRYSPNSTVELRKLDQAMVLNRLLAESFAPSSRLGTGQFGLLVNCVRAASCYELSFATLDDALPAIIGLAQ